MTTKARKAPAKPRAKAKAKAPAKASAPAPKAAAPTQKAAEDATVEEIASAVDIAEPQTLVGGAELAGQQLANNQVGTMMKPDAEGIPDRDE